MPSYKIAVLKHGGIELIVIPQATIFEYKTRENQLAMRAELQSHIEDAGFTGSVCLVWPYAGGMKFLAPQTSHDFFKTLSIDKVHAEVNNELVWRGTEALAMATEHTGRRRPPCADGGGGRRL